jgi:hypothetical protein
VVGAKTSALWRCVHARVRESECRFESEAQEGASEYAGEKKSASRRVRGRHYHSILLLLAGASSAVFCAPQARREANYTVCDAAAVMRE